MKLYLPRKIATYATALFFTASSLASCSSGVEANVDTNQKATAKDGGVVNQEINYNIHIHTQCPDGTYEKNQPSSRPSSPIERPSSPSQKEQQPESSQPSGDQQLTIDDAVNEDVQQGSDQRESRREWRSSPNRSPSSYTPSRTTSSGCPDYQAPQKDVSYRTGFKPVGSSTCAGEYQQSMKERHANYQNLQ